MGVCQPPSLPGRCSSGSSSSLGLLGLIHPPLLPREADQYEGDRYMLRDLVGEQNAMSLTMALESMPAFGPSGVSACGGWSCFPPGCFFCAPPALWALSRRARNRAVHALHGNGRKGRSSGASAAAAGTASRGRGQQPARAPARGSGAASVQVVVGGPGARFRATPTTVRAQVAGKAALKAELEAAGYTVNLALGPNALLHFY